VRDCREWKHADGYGWYVMVHKEAGVVDVDIADIGEVHEVLTLLW
jgi:hypothetical protein